MENEKDLLEELANFMTNSGKTIATTFEKMSKELHDAVYETCPQCQTEFSIYMKNQKEPKFCPACGYDLTTKEDASIGYVERLSMAYIEQMKELDLESGHNIVARLLDIFSPNTDKNLFGVFDTKTNKLVGYGLTDHADAGFFKDCKKWSNNERVIHSLYVLPVNSREEYREILLKYIQENIGAPIFAALTKPEDIKLFQKNGFKQVDTFIRFDNIFSINFYDKESEK